LNTNKFKLFRGKINESTLIKKEPPFFKTGPLNVQDVLLNNQCFNLYLPASFFFSICNCIKGLTKMESIKTNAPGISTSLRLEIV
jgi:hypothetical protein